MKIFGKKNGTNNRAVVSGIVRFRLLKVAVAGD